MAGNTDSAPVARVSSYLRAAWHKYGLIVIGNVVFFALLYFVQYRPNSRENRATELLTMAQREEAEARVEAAETLYRKVVSDYEDCSAAKVATERLPKVLALAQKKRQTQPKLPAACTPKIDVHELLELGPTFYIAELLGAFYPDVQPRERERYFKALDGYVWLALNRDHVALDKLKKSPSFKAGELVNRYFALKTSARFVSDYVYDDFKIKNVGFFTLHNVVLDLTAKQGDRSEQVSLRVPEFKIDSEVDVLELRVTKDDGEVSVEGRITADEGSAAIKQRL